MRWRSANLANTLTYRHSPKFEAVHYLLYSNQGKSERMATGYRYKSSVRKELRTRNQKERNLTV